MGFCVSFCAILISRLSKLPGIRDKLCCEVVEIVGDACSIISPSFSVPALFVMKSVSSPPFAKPSMPLIAKGAGCRAS